jgi:cell shape-determining protein MreC
MALEEDLRQTEDQGFKKGIIFIIIAVVILTGLAIGIRYVNAVKAERDALLQQVKNLKEENQFLDDRLSSMKLYEGEYKRDNQKLKAENEQLKKELAAAKKPKAKPKPAPAKKTTKKKR